MTQNVIESWVDAARDHLSPAADAKRDLPHGQAALDLGGETKNLRINLALQGGGAHGAFTWGVLEALLEHSPFKLFVGATQANTGKLRVFREHEMSLDVLMASACLPRMFTPVEIEGQPYWDGGYSANPPVSPLFYDCDSEDVLLVLLNPLQHEATPRTAQEIDTRLGEIATNANFMREMQLFAKVAEFTRADALRDDNFAQRRDRMNGNQPGHLS